jgi:hypothetical protein
MQAVSDINDEFLGWKGVLVDLSYLFLVSIFDLHLLMLGTIQHLFQVSVL